MLSKTTRDAIALLDTLVGPQQLEELTNRVRKAITHVPRENELQGMVEESYLRTALALCLARSTDTNQHFFAITHLEDVVQAEDVPDRLRMLARYYQSVIRLAGHFPTQDPHQILLPPGEVLATLADHFQQIAELAESIDEYLIAGTCWSLAAECTLRANGNQAHALTLAGTANMAFLYVDESQPNLRMRVRSAVAEQILQSGACETPKLARFSALLYEPGELLKDT